MAMEEPKTAMPEEEKDEHKQQEGNETCGEGGKEGGEAGSKEAAAEENGLSSGEQIPGEDPAVEEPEKEEETEGRTEPGSEEKAGDGQADAGEDPEKAGKKKGVKLPFGTKKELQKKDAEIADLKDRLMRQMAEFDNFRKRTDREKAVRFDDGAMYVLLKLLPVADNFERGLAQIPEEVRKDPYVSGMEMIYKQLMGVLTECGVTPIEAKEKEFDPNLHNAVMHVEDEELGENIVAEEFQKGYLYKDNVLRHSMVKVAN